MALSSHLHHDELLLWQLLRLRKDELHFAVGLWVEHRTSLSLSAWLCVEVLTPLYLRVILRHLASRLGHPRRHYLVLATDYGSVSCVGLLHRI